MLSTLEQLKARSIHIATHPPPRSLSETRLILAALQKFGEVVTFRSLKYDLTNNSPTKHSSTIVTFDSPTSAKIAIESSPIHIQIPLPDTTTLHNHNPPHNNKEFNPRHLKCILSPSRHNHESALKRNPFYTRFEPDTSSKIFKDLVHKTGIPLPELADLPAARKEFLPMRERKRTHLTTVRLGGGSLMGLYREGVRGEAGRKEGEREG